MAHLLEVIVTSPEEAREAERGGADRLELVRALELGGLTPAFETVEQVLRAVEIPVRVMLRETPTMSVDSPEDLERLQDFGSRLAFAPRSIDGVVLGFLNEDAVDERALGKTLEAAPGVCATFHRAFDEVADPFAAIAILKNFPQIDRILTVGGAGEWPIRKHRLQAWQSAADPSIQLLVGVGLSAADFRDLAASEVLREVHVGRAARVGHRVEGAIDADEVRALKSRLA